MSSQPRIRPLREDELSPQQRDLVASVGGPAGDAGARNIFLTAVRHPGLFRRWLPFGGKLLTGKLPPRDREMLILRTAVNCDAEYEWVQHVRIGLASGLTADEIELIKVGPLALEGFDVELLRAADELHEESVISDPTWNALAKKYDEMQLLEVPMVVGHYHLVAYTLNSLGVALEPGADTSIPLRD